MNQTSSIIKIATVVIVIAVIGFFGYNYLNGSSSSSGDISIVPNSDTSAVGAQVLSALNQLNRLNLDAGIFSNPTFKSLKDFSRPLPTEPVGRINPFSPIGIDASISNSTSTTDQKVKAPDQKKKPTVTSQ